MKQNNENIVYTENKDKKVDIDILQSILYFCNMWKKKDFVLKKRFLE